MDRAHHLHPFTDHALMHPTGTHVITSGEGVYLYGEEGKLIDGLGAFLHTDMKIVSLLSVPLVVLAVWYAVRRLRNRIMRSDDA